MPKVTFDINKKPQDRERERRLRYMSLSPKQKMKELCVLIELSNKLSKKKHQP
jgi:hypothetical protein